MRDANPLFAYTYQFTLCVKGVVFIMSTFHTYACSKLWLPLVIGWANCALFNAVPNVYLHIWKERVKQGTKYRNDVLVMPASGRKNKRANKNSWNMPLDMKRIILANMNMELYSSKLNFAR